jgi:class 3 adenylate cyclase
MRCQRCGEERPDRGGPCGSCGEALPRVPAAHARKVVTLVFVDLVGSTALGERLDAESVRWVMSRFYETAQEILEGHGGTVEKFVGDAVLAVFGIPRAREDDALRGVRAASELRDRLQGLGREVGERFGAPFSARIGVNTGEVIAGDGTSRQAFASGDAVNVAARMEQAAAPGEVLLGEATMRLVRDAVRAEPVGPLALAGKAAPVSAWRLVEVATRGTGVSRWVDVPLVGRSSELARLYAAWRNALDEQAVRVVHVIGPAGMGKSRLLGELAQRVQADGRVLRGSCLHYGDGITFWPIAEVLRQAGGIDDGDPVDEVERKLAALVEGADDRVAVLERIGPAVGLPGSGAVLEEAFWAIRRVFETLARRQPLLVILDDVHWAEETLLDLIEYLGWTRGVPLLLVCAARPELLERRPSPVGPSAGASTIALQPLDEQEVAQLMLRQLDSMPLPDSLHERVLEVAGGNPLFVQELVRMLVDDGLIVRRDGVWETTSDVHELAMPPTVQAVLATRLDQLEPAERDVAQRASVVGQVFWAGAVRDLSAEAERARVRPGLHALVRQQVIVPEVSTFAAEDAFRFAHVLVRDAAYASLAKQARAELHERSARWLERARGGAASDQDEILGYHLEQAATYLHELGDTIEAARVAVNASLHLAGAGRRALAAGDLPAAATLLGRAADILPAGDPQRLEIRLQSVTALFETGRFEKVEAGLAEILADAGETRLQLAARAWSAILAMHKGRPDHGVEAAATAWLAACEEAGDHAGQGTALGFLAKLRFWLDDRAGADAIWWKAAEHAALAGDSRAEADSLVYLLISTMYGSTPVDAALERCDTIAHRVGVSRKVRVMASIQRGVLEAMRGDTVHGRELVARGREELEELGQNLLAEAMAIEAVIVEEMAGDPAAQEDLLRPCFDRLEKMGATGFQMTVVCLLTRALCSLGRHEEARHLIVAHYATALEDDDTSGLPQSAMALVAAGDGDDATAVSLAREAVDLGSAGDSPLMHAARLVDLADVHVLGGRRDDALAVLAEADAQYLRKGCVAGLDGTAMRRAALSEISPGV